MFTSFRIWTSLEGEHCHFQSFSFKLTQAIDELSSALQGVHVATQFWEKGKWTQAEMYKLQVRAGSECGAIPGPGARAYALDGSVSATSTPIFASKSSFWSIFRDPMSNSMLKSASTPVRNSIHPCMRPPDEAARHSGYRRSFSGATDTACHGGVKARSSGRFRRGYRCRQRRQYEKMLESSIFFRLLL